jgi:chloride channel protein, CIC family
MNSRAESEAIGRTSVGQIAFLCGLSAAIGLLAGGAAWVLVHGIALLTNVPLFRRVGWTLPTFADLHPGPWLLVVAAGAGIFVLGALGVGYDAIDDVLAGRLAITVVAVLLVAKLVAWWVALASGTSGGTLAPIPLIGPRGRAKR